MNLRMTTIVPASTLLQHPIQTSRIHNPPCEDIKVSIYLQKSELQAPTL